MNIRVVREQAPNMVDELIVDKLQSLGVVEETNFTWQKCSFDVLFGLKLFLTIKKTLVGQKENKK